MGRCLDCDKRIGHGSFCSSCKDADDAKRMIGRRVKDRRDDVDFAFVVTRAFKNEAGSWCVGNDVFYARVWEVENA